MGHMHWLHGQTKVEHKFNKKWKYTFLHVLLAHSHSTNWNAVSWRQLTLVNCLKDSLCTEMIVEVGKREEGGGGDGKREKERKDEKERRKGWKGEDE